MRKSDLLKSIAEKGYDVGFGAKKHLATYDIVEKLPGLIALLSMAYGILSLANTFQSGEISSALLTVFGIVALYISFYDRDKTRYNNAGKELTQIFDELKFLYFKVKALDESSDFSALENEFISLKERHQSSCISKQIMFGGWYAHYKFFWEHQIDWVDEQLKFGFFRDKVPLSLWFTMVVLIVGVILGFSDVATIACSSIKS